MRRPVFWYALCTYEVQTMFQDVVNLNTPLKLQGEILEVVEQFAYLGSCVCSYASLLNEIDARISKARIAFLIYVTYGVRKV